MASLPACFGPKERSLSVFFGDFSIPLLSFYSKEPQLPRGGTDNAVLLGSALTTK